MRRIVWRRRRTLPLVLAVLIALVSVGYLVCVRLTALPADAVLRTGEVTVTEGEFRERVDVLTALYGARPPEPGPDLDRFERDAAQAVATSIVVDRVAGELGVAATDEEARTALDQSIAARFNGDRAAFARSLGNLRISEADMTNEIRRQLTAGRVFDRITADVPPVSDADVAAAYEQRRAELVVPESRRLRNIVLDAPDKAQAVAAQARGGADVAALARTSSLDRSTSEAGGDIGSVTVEQLEPAIAQAAFATPQGGVYGPAQGRFGWNVGQVVAITPAQPQTLDQVRVPLRDRLTEERKLQRWQPWLTDRVREAEVEYAERYRPANPDELPPATIPR